MSVGSKTTIQAANPSGVEKVKTGHGMTKFLIRNEEGPNIMVRYRAPDTKFDAHAHPFDEMWYVLEGEVEFNDTAYGVGSVVFIPRGVPYLPKTPKGVVLLRYAGGMGG